MPAKKGERKGDLALAERPRTRKPRRFRVILFNDDYTTIEFVAAILQVVFRKSPQEAIEITMRVHEEGRGIAGIYPHEVAESKVVAVHERAREAGYPLRAGLEDEGC